MIKIKIDTSRSVALPDNKLQIAFYCPDIRSFGVMAVVVDETATKDQIRAEMETLVAAKKTEIEGTQTLQTFLEQNFSGDIEVDV